MSEPTPSVTSSGDDPRPFDFRHPSTLSRDDARVLQVIQESLAHGVAATLASVVRASIDVEIAGVEQTPYGEVVRRTPNPSSLTLMRLEPLSSKALFQVDPELSFALVELLLGGDGAGERPDRAHTEVEEALLIGLIDMLTATFDEAFEPLTAVASEIVGQESNPTFVQIAPATDSVVSFTLDVGVDATRAAMRLMLPAAAVRPYLDALNAEEGDVSQQQTERTAARELVTEHLSAVDVVAIARFDPAIASPSQLADLRVGDIFLLDHAVDAPLVVEVDGVPVHDVSIGRVKRNLAVEVLGAAPSGVRRANRVVRIPAD